MSKITPRLAVRLTAAVYLVATVGTVALVNSCNKSGTATAPLTQTVGRAGASGKGVATGANVNAPTNNANNHAFQTYAVKVAAVRKSADGSSREVMFNQLAEIFSVGDDATMALLQDAASKNKTVNVTVDPWRGILLQASVSAATAPAGNMPQANSTITGHSFEVSHATVDFDDPEAMGVLNTTTGALVDVIPDMPTAQRMFDYITTQCCAVPGPYTIDYCIPFQYVLDGCYARAHKMCWILNNKYNYATHKIFSFANAGSDRLSVKAEKWGGCCVTWWYHVAPLVNIKTPLGTKAYVFDPGMFDQPVLLSEWLHAQSNPACSGSAHVSMINIQPTTSYSPSSYSGYSFDTDPTYSATNSTLTSYASLTTCP